MKLTTALATVIAATVLVFGNQSSLFAQEASRPGMSPPPIEMKDDGGTKLLDIAAWDKSSNSVRLLEDRLAKTFEDGTPIETMRIEEMAGAIYLVRQGKDANGNCITDTIALEPDEQTKTLALRLNGRGGSNRCHGFFCSLCKPFNPQTGCQCDIGWFCNHETRDAKGALSSNIVFVQ